jgi:endoglucanase
MDRLLSEAEQDEAKTGGKPPTDVRLLLTRAEEVGFAGAIAACGSGLIPHDALLINLENSKSDPTDSPIGGGPIVRVGDRQSTFDPDATYRLGRLAQHLADQPSPQGQTPFAFQRKLMPGGICEASAFVAWGYRAGALCLPLGNYHNMDETTGRIAAEHIALADFDRLVTLLTALARPGAWEDPQIAGGLRQRLEGLFDRRRALLEESVRG